MPTPDPRPPRRLLPRLLPHVLGALALLLLLAVLAATALMAAALQPQPAVSGSAASAGFDLRRGWALWRAHDPRRLRPGQPGNFRLQQSEVQLLVEQAALRGPPGTAARLALGDGVALLQASLPLPSGALPAALARHAGGWLNLQLRLVQTRGLPAVDALQVGRLPVPSPLALPLLRWALQRTAPAAVPLLGVLRELQFNDGSLDVAYVWGDDSAQALGAALLPELERSRLQAYALAITQAAGDGAVPWPLPQLLQTVFALAAQRSGTEADALLENRAALRVLALYAAGRPMQPWLPAGARAAAGPPRPLLLHGRVDFPQHLLISAALAAEGGGPLADAIGLYKELLDAREGSGFSFNDMAADRAGARIGLLAVRQPLRLQQRLAAGAGEMALLPDVSDLPEYLPESVFRRRYGAVGSPAYNAVMADIERRLDGSPLLP